MYLNSYWGSPGSEKKEENKQGSAHKTHIYNKEMEGGGGGGGGGGT